MYKELYKAAADIVICHIDQVKKTYTETKLKSADQRSLFKIAGELLHKLKDLALPLFDSAHDLVTCSL